jgi:hypothetical protein
MSANREGEMMEYKFLASLRSKKINTSNKEDRSRKITGLCSLLMIFLGVFFISCSAKTPYSLNPRLDKNPAQVIAVVPFDNKTVDIIAPQLLRSKVVDELYFKGYKKLSVEEIDKKLGTLYYKEAKRENGFIAPQVVNELVGADAVMYCTLTEGGTSVNFLYKPVTISARCELRSAKSGEVLWNAQYKATSRNFGFTRKELEIKSCASYETIIEEVVIKMLETLPEGPKFRG